MALRFSVRSANGLLQQFDLTADLPSSLEPGATLILPGSVSAAAVTVLQDLILIEDPVLGGLHAIARAPGTRIVREGEEETHLDPGAEPLFEAAAVQVAATTDAIASDAVESPASVVQRVEPPSGFLSWLPEGLLPQLAGVGLVLGVAALADDDDSDSDTTSSNRTPAIVSNGGGATAAVSAAENSTAVTNVAAVDLDGNTVRYSITGGADAALFAINSTTGALSFIAAPNFESPQDAGSNNVYDVIVAAGDGTLSDTQALAVTVTNVNEAPDITSDGGGATAAISVDENSMAVTTVLAADPDAGNELRYSIGGGADADRFAIDSANGALSFVAAPDFETPLDEGADNVYDLIVIVGDGSLTDSQALAVTVIDLTEPTASASLDPGGVAKAGLSSISDAMPSAIEFQSAFFLPDTLAP